MEYLARYISESLAEIIKCPANPEILLQTESDKLDEMLIEGAEYTIEEIQLQEEKVNSLQKQVETFSRLMDEGFVEFVHSKEPKTELGEVMEVSYSLQNSKVRQNWAVVVDKVYYKNKAELLKKNIESSDYKIIKCYESSLLNEPLPYDIHSLISERKAIRDEINTIDDFIRNL